MNIGWINNDYTHQEAIELSAQAAKDGMILIPHHYKNDFYDTKSEYKIDYGSRVSAKSWVKCLEFLHRCDTHNYFRGIFARQTQKDAKDSQFQLFKDLITNKFPFLQDYFEIRHTIMEIKHKNGNFAKGFSFEKPARSIAEFTDLWIDEPITRNGSVGRSDLLDLKGTLRNSYNVPSQVHLTFNPISKQTWIYKDFFEKKIFKNTKVKQCNFEHNVFAPPDKVQEFLDYKEIDPDRYQCDALGNWGDIKSDNPFFLHTNRIMFKDHKIIDMEDLYESFDFNFDPTTVIYAQLIYGYGLLIHDCIQAKGTENLCHETKHIVFGHAGRVLVTGDFSGNQRSAVGGIQSGQEITDFLHVEKTHEILPSNFIGTRHVNPLIHLSRDLCNNVMYKIPVYFNNNEGCRNLFEDLKKANTIVDKSGKVSLFKNRELGFGMDMTDAFRYLLNAMFKNINNDVNKFLGSM